MHVSKKIFSLYEKYLALTHTSKQRRTPAWNVNKLEPFVHKISGCLDISCKDPVAKKKLEKIYDVKMTDVEEKFLADQLGPTLMFCTIQVDKAWAKTTERRKKEDEGQKKLFEKEKSIIEEREKKEDTIFGDEEDFEIDIDSSDIDFSMTEEQEGQGKKRKRDFVMSEGATTADLPTHWNHLRPSPHKVRPEYYRVVDKLIAKWHCSVDQAVAAVVEVGRGLFGLPWKFHDEGQVIDLDTVPHRQSQLLASKAIEAHTLSKIAQKIVESPSNATVTLHDDGSRAQGCGGYSVSGVTLPGSEPETTIYYPFPTLPIAKETRENLADLKLTILSILSTCGGVSRQSIWSKVDFVMTDSVSHNREVEDLVS